MPRTEKNAALEHFLVAAGSEMGRMIEDISTEDILAAADRIIACRERGGRVHVSGIGKPGHVAGYAASLLSSTGTPSYVLDGTEAVHGSSGQTLPGDVVVVISNSGETAEMKATVTTLKANGCQIIGVSSRNDSWLARESDSFLFAGVKEEGGPLDRAPRLSVLSETFVIQALSVVLQAHYGITPQQYVKWHPGGALGKLREGE